MEEKGENANNLRMLRSLRGDGIPAWPLGEGEGYSAPCRFFSRRWPPN